MFGIVWVYNKVMNTPSMIVGPSTILLQPHVGRFHASDENTPRKVPPNLDFLPTLRTSLAIKWGYSSMQVLQ